MSRAQIVENVLRSLKETQALTFEAKMAAVEQGLVEAKANRFVPGELAKRITKALESYNK
jgi:hypothetical protein